MHKFMAFFKLFRVGNLFMTACLFYIVRYGLFTPLYSSLGLSPQLSHIEFFFLTLSTILTMAAGYLINDYFDVGIDRINHPQTVYVGNVMTAEFANALFYVISMAAVIIGFILGKWVEFVNLGSIYIVASLALYFYSLRYKRRVFWGNFVIALLSGYLIIHIWLFEFFALHRNIDMFFEAQRMKWFQRTNFMVFFYAGFSFLISFIREVVKDMEDQRGDEAEQCKTLAIVLGVRRTKILLWTMTFLLLAGVGVFQYFLVAMQGWYYVLSLLILVQIPLAVLMLKLQRVETTKQYHRISTGLKIIMFLGILSLFATQTLL